MTVQYNEYSGWHFPLTIRKSLVWSQEETQMRLKLCQKGHPVWNLQNMQSYPLWWPLVTIGEAKSSFGWGDFKVFRLKVPHQSSSYLLDCPFEASDCDIENVSHTDRDMRVLTVRINLENLASHTHTHTLKQYRLCCWDCRRVIFDSFTVVKIKWLKKSEPNVKSLHCDAAQSMLLFLCPATV